MMTAEVHNLLAAARRLTPQEQLELLQGLAQALSQQTVQSLAPANAAFWSHRSLADMASEGAIPVVTDIHQLAMPAWPPDETADDLVDYLKRQRQADRKA